MISNRQRFLTDRQTACVNSDVLPLQATAGGKGSGRGWGGGRWCEGDGESSGSGRESLERGGVTPLPPPTALTLPQRHSHTPTPAPHRIPNRQKPPPPTAVTPPVTALQPLRDCPDGTLPFKQSPGQRSVGCDVGDGGVYLNVRAPQVMAVGPGVRMVWIWPLYSARHRGTRTGRPVCAALRLRHGAWYAPRRRPIRLRRSPDPPRRPPPPPPPRHKGRPPCAPRRIASVAHLRALPCTRGCVCSPFEAQDPPPPSHSSPARVPWRGH